MDWNIEHTIPKRQEIFLFSRTLRPALGSTQPPI